MIVAVALIGLLVVLAQWAINEEAFGAVVVVNDAANGPMHFIINTDIKGARILLGNFIALYHRFAGKYFTVKGRIVLVEYGSDFFIGYIFNFYLIYFLRARLAVNAIFCDGAKIKEFFMNKIIVVAAEAGMRAK